MTFSRRAGLMSLAILSMLLGQGAWRCASAEPAVSSAKKPRAPVCDRAAFRVVVDVGHTAESPGAKSARGFGEYDFNLRLATAIDKSLIDAGFRRTILLVTDGPTRKGLVTRVTRANASAADLFLSIHHDSVPDSFLEGWHYEGQVRYFSDRFKGHSIFISSENPDFEGSLQFGRLLGTQLKARGLPYTPHYTLSFMGHRQRILVDAQVGVYRYDQLIVLRTTRMPAVLLEAGSIINREEELVMSSPERQSLISAAVTDAVESFCVARKPRNSDQIARPPGTAAKQALPHEGVTPAASSAKPR
jgi:N-acetylmuramoyl-L-alanine amidase